MARPRITRRHVLAATAAVAAAGVAGVGTTAWRWWDRPPGAGRATLSDDEHAFVQALAEAWMPPGGTPAISGAEAGLGDFFDALLLTVTPANRTLLKLLIQVLDDWTLPTRLQAYRHLDRPTREAVLYGWLHHDNHLVRGAIQGLVVLIAMGWTTHPQVAPSFQTSMNCWYGR